MFTPNVTQFLMSELVPLLTPCLMLFTIPSTAIMSTTLATSTSISASLAMNLVPSLSGSDVGGLCSTEQRRLEEQTQILSLALLDHLLHFTIDLEYLSYVLYSPLHLPSSGAHLKNEESKIHQNILNTID